MPAFLQQSNAVIKHDASAQLGRIAAPTLITFGAADQVTSVRFAAELKTKIQRSELLIFDGCAHAALYEKVEEFNRKTLAFQQRPTVASAAKLRQCVKSDLVMS